MTLPSFVDYKPAPGLPREQPWRDLTADQAYEETPPGLVPANYCTLNDLTKLTGLVGEAARTGCFDAKAFGTQQQLANKRTNGLYILSEAYARGLGYHKVGVIERKTNTNAVCHVPSQHGKPIAGKNITCSGKVSSTYYSFDNLYSTTIGYQM